MTHILKTTAAALAVLTSLAALSPAAAQDGAGTAVFAVQRTSTSQVSAAAWAFQRGDFVRAERLARAALSSPARLSPSRRSVAYANWCASLSMTGQHEAALEACNTAVALRPDNWRAHLNQASALHRAGSPASAQAAYAQASALAPGAEEVVRAASQFSSRSLASAE